MAQLAWEVRGEEGREGRTDGAGRGGGVGVKCRISVLPRPSFLFLAASPLQQAPAGGSGWFGRPAGDFNINTGAGAAGRATAAPRPPHGRPTAAADAFDGVVTR